MTKPIIVHISADYPDSLRPRKTPAVLNLVENTPEYRHIVYSLNRFTALGGIESLPFGEDRTALAYGALPKGLFWDDRFRALARWIIADLKGKNIQPALVEAHKFTIEGPISQHVASALSCPLICDIQGNTDVTILKKKPGFRKRYRTLAGQASLVFPYAPWAVAPFEKLAGLTAEKTALLPVMPHLDSLSPAPCRGTGRLISIFNLDNWAIKNLKGLLKAVAMVSEKIPAVRVDIYGQGAPQSLKIVRKLIRQAGQQGRVFLKGPVDNAKLPEIMKNYDAFVMPTLHESYGLVYIESLFSGLPVLYSKGRSIDGYFDERSIGYACDPNSTADIAAGIEYLLTQEKTLKNTIAAMQARGDFDLVRRAHILSTYRKGLENVLNANQRKAA